jgi:hypothetical protein
MLPKIVPTILNKENNPKWPPAGAYFFNNFKIESLVVT